VLKFKKPHKKPDKPVPVKTEELIKKLSARRILRLNLTASFFFSLAAVAGAIGLASLFFVLDRQSIDHILKIQGVLQAIEQSSPVTHSTGGIVSNIFVTEGEIVSEGQILMSLDASDIESEFIAAQRRVATLMLRSLCVQAKLKKVTTITIPSELKIALGRLNQLVEMRRSLRDCKGQLRKIALDALQEREKKNALQNQIQTYYRLSQTDQKMRVHLRQLGKNGEDKDLQDMLNFQVLVAALKNQILLAELEEELIYLEAEQEKSHIRKSQALNRALDQIVDLLAEAENRLAKLESIKSNRFIYASNSGRVQRLRVKESGKRIARGAYILEIAPLTTNFEVVATINVSDMSYIELGQEVSIYLSSGLPSAVSVPARIAKIAKATENTRTVTIEIAREELNRRDLLVGDRSLNGLGERAEALVEVKSDSALKALETIFIRNFSGYL
jgi:multidrug efflux pump subunit AcrA (membrane-fusion protein)